MYNQPLQVALDMELFNDPAELERRRVEEAERRTVEEVERSKVEEFGNTSREQDGRSLG